MVCKKPLKGKQSKYCSGACKAKWHRMLRLLKLATRLHKVIDEVFAELIEQQ